jgi:mannose-6-phosphate isomerase-like protein (cupin superfamily)
MMSGGRDGWIMHDRMTLQAALTAARESADKTYGVLLEHGTLELGFYKPDGIDPQEPHEQDEVYMVLSGTGYFVKGEERQAFEPGEALFVPAGMVHRFEDFSEDFAAWVVFYGPPGGESSQEHQ